MKNIKAHLYVALATLLIGGSFIVSQQLSGLLDPVYLTLLRFLASTLLLFPIIITKQQFRDKLKQTFGRSIILSFFYTLYFVTLFIALKYTSSINTGALYTLVPFLTGIASIFVFKQKITLKQSFVYILGTLGTLIIVSGGTLDNIINMTFNRGDLIFLISVISMSTYSILMKVFLKEDDEPLVFVFMTLLSGCFWLVLASIILNIKFQVVDFSFEFIFSFIYLVIFATFGTLFLYFKASQLITPKKITGYIYLSPAFVALLLYVFKGINLNSGIILGLTITSIATFILLKDKETEPA